MAHVTADRVRDTSTTTGTGAFAVSGTAPTGYRTFSAVLATNDTCWYAIQHQTAAEWEVGLGTYSSANTITRTTVLASSNSGNAVSFSAGTKDVFITLAAGKTVQLDASGNASALGTVASATLTNATGLPISTGVSGLGTGVATFLATPSSANLASAVTGETGSGALVFGTSPSFTTSALFPDGTASAPSIGHAGDTNTGFWFPAADTIAASTSGLEALRITSAGNVGIGTSSPAALLHLEKNLAGEISEFIYNPNASGYAALRIGNSDRGTNGDHLIYGSSVLGLRSKTGAAITFEPAGTERMRITSGGDVGIGTSSPAYKLDVNGSIAMGAALYTGTGVSTGDANIELGGSRTGSGNSYIDFHAVASTDYESRIIRYSGANGNFDIIQSGTGALRFYTNNVERMQIDSNANVRVGTAAIATTATDGFLYVPTCAGTPTGTPTAITGLAPIVINTTNNKLYFYSGGAWRDAGP